LDACQKGFMDQMAQEGYIDGKTVQYDISNAEGDMSVVASIAKKFVSQKKDLIFSITTPCTQAVAAATKGTGIPVIFGAMTDPVAAKVAESWERPGGNVTGCSDWMDVGAQVKVVKEIVPGVKVLGTIYNAGEVNSRVQIAELKKAAPGLGIKKIVEVNAASSADVLAAAKSLMGRVDAVWFPTDNIVTSALEALVKVCEDNKVPLFGSDVNQVKRGVIASCGIDFYDLGKEAGKMAKQVLDGRNPAEMPIKKGKMGDLWVNPSAAKRMGITIPQAVMAKATKVINK
ncbi:MAG: ABC transporter substrate-binding protein, partial [Deltaproteobacteria bacterium]|nr:ABC transporter substrate-binding protein [Deltaproteobacteria bacterium]